MDPTASRKCEVIEVAAFISAERRGARPATWADDRYTGVGFVTVIMTAADQHEEANAEREEAELRVLSRRELERRELGSCGWRV